MPRHRFYTAALVLATLALAPGCAGAGGEGEKKQGEVRGEKGEKKLTVKYRGKTADQWAPLLYDADGNVRDEAAEALRSIGNEGFPFLIEGIKKGDEGLKFLCVERMGTKQKQDNEPLVLPLLKKWLKSPIPSYRERSAGIIAECDFFTALPDLEAALANETDAQTTQALRRAVKRLKTR